MAVRVGKDQLKALHAYSACDISDALLKLDVKGAGFVDELSSLSTFRPNAGQLAQKAKVIAPASTVRFVRKDYTPGSDEGAKNLTNGNHWADLTKRDTAVVVVGPDSHAAMVGGIIASRIHAMGAQTVLVKGRIRDLEELESLRMPIWASKTSTQGSGGELKAFDVDVPVSTGNSTTITPGDIMFCDPSEGVVAIPGHLVGKLLEILPQLTMADDRVKADVQEGVSVGEAFKNHRGKL